MENQAKLNMIIANALKVIRNPVEFYQNMPKSGGFADPLIFILVMSVTMGLLTAILSLFGAGVVGAMAVGFGAIIFVPIFAIIGSFIGAGILFVIWRLMGSEQSYETAYRCIAFASAIYPIMALIGLIPYLGTIVGVVWGMYLMITASIEVHQLNRKTVYTVFGILGALILVINVSSEIATRRMVSQVGELQKQFGNLGQQYQSGDMTPEQTGKAMGDLFKFLGGATNSANDSQSNSNDSLLEQAPTTTDKQVTPEQTGKAMGDFFKFLDQVAKSANDTESDSNGSILEQAPTTTNNQMTPEQAGQALGGFLKGLEQATKGLAEQNNTQSTADSAQ